MKEKNTIVNINDLIRIKIEIIKETNGYNKDENKIIDVIDEIRSIKYQDEELYKKIISVLYLDYYLDLINKKENSNKKELKILEQITSLEELELIIDNDLKILYKFLNSLPNLKKYEFINLLNQHLSITKNQTSRLINICPTYINELIMINNFYKLNDIIKAYKDYYKENNQDYIEFIIQDINQIKLINKDLYLDIIKELIKIYYINQQTIKILYEENNYQEKNLKITPEFLTILEETNYNDLIKKLNNEDIKELLYETLDVSQDEETIEEKIKYLEEKDKGNMLRKLKIK